MAAIYPSKIVHYITLHQRLILSRCSFYLLIKLSRVYETGVNQSCLDQVRSQQADPEGHPQLPVHRLHEPHSRKLHHQPEASKTLCNICCQFSKPGKGLFISYVSFKVVYSQIIEPTEHSL